MDKERLERRAHRLYSLWRVMIAFLSIGVSVYMAYQEAINGVNLRTLPNTFHFILGAVLAAVFVPMLVLVRKWAKAADSDKLYAKATKWIWIFVIAITGTLFCNILAFFIPGLFS